MRGSRVGPTRVALSVSKNKGVLSFAIFLAVVCAMMWTVISGKDPPQQLALRFEPIRFDQQGFHAVVAGCDRMVVRKGGFTCHGDVDRDPVLLELTNRVEVQAFARSVQFAPVLSTNTMLETCLCCGYPGIDWYIGKRRVAVTAVQHLKRLRWDGFTGARVLSVPYGYGDAPLTLGSSQWLSNWFQQHGVPIQP